jgi:hypothetical protein
MKFPSAMLFHIMVSVMLFQSIASASTIVDKREQIVLKDKDARLEKLKAFRTAVKAEVSKLGKLAYDHDLLFIKNFFETRVKNEAEEFLKNLTSCPYPDPNLVRQTQEYLRHLNAYPYHTPWFQNRTNLGEFESLVNLCHESIILVQEPPNLLKTYIANIPNDLNRCKTVLTRGYQWYSFVDLVHNQTGLFTDCAENGKNVQKIEMDAYQDAIDNFIVAVSDAREGIRHG